MAYSQTLAERITNHLERQEIAFQQKKMMGGLCFMVDDKMCMGIVKDLFMARLDPVQCAELITRDGFKPMDFSGKVLKGYVLIEDFMLVTDEALTYWMAQCLAFNPKAKRSKRS